MPRAARRPGQATVVVRCSCGSSRSSSSSCEVGDRDKPRLVFFLDEAHLLFDGASKAFAESTVQTVRLIRSKGVGVFFVTQQPKDVPADVLGQLGNVQHALRAFTPDDAKALRATVGLFRRPRHTTSRSS